MTMDLLRYPDAVEAYRDLRPAQRKVIRAIDAAGGLRRTFDGFTAPGHPTFRLATVRPLIAQRLVRRDHDAGGTLRLTPLGAAVFDLITDPPKTRRTRPARRTACPTSTR